MESVPASPRHVPEGAAEALSPWPELAGAGWEGREQAFLTSAGTGDPDEGAGSIIFGWVGQNIQPNWHATLYARVCEEGVQMENDIPCIHNFQFLWVLGVSKQLVGLEVQMVQQ